MSREIRAADARVLKRDDWGGFFFHLLNSATNFFYLSHWLIFLCHVTVGFFFFYHVIDHFHPPPPLSYTMMVFYVPTLINSDQNVQTYSMRLDNMDSVKVV